MQTILEHDTSGKYSHVSMRINTNLKMGVNQSHDFLKANGP